mmetsp:Transcript_44618/g.96980  ORF Transcript_44618/g.96980 Transcript_44618/m.96980 type:complete len:215 (+) Transcript_44618:601-1245(+)
MRKESAGNDRALRPRGRPRPGLGTAEAGAASCLKARPRAAGISGSSGLPSRSTSSRGRKPGMPNCRLVTSWLMSCSKGSRSHASRPMARSRRLLSCRPHFSCSQSKGRRLRDARDPVQHLPLLRGRLLAGSRCTPSWGFQDRSTMLRAAASRLRCAAALPPSSRPIFLASRRPLRASERCESFGKALDRYGSSRSRPLSPSPQPARLSLCRARS